VGVGRRGTRTCWDAPLPPPPSPPPPSPPPPAPAMPPVRRRALHPQCPGDAPARSSPRRALRPQCRDDAMARPARQHPPHPPPSRHWSPSSHFQFRHHGYRFQTEPGSTWGARRKCDRSVAVGPLRHGRRPRPSPLPAGHATVSPQWLRMRRRRDGGLSQLRRVEH
jgi:hypothetical protein